MGDDQFGLDGMFTDLDTAAVGLHEMYESWVRAGFTEDQALALVGHMLTAALHNPNNGGA